MQKRWFVSAFILLLLAGLLVLKKPSPSSSDSLSPSEAQSTKSKGGSLGARTQAQSKSGNLLRTPPSTIEPSPNFPKRGTHTAGELGNFYLPDLEIKNATLAEAVAELLQAYADTCAHTNQASLLLDLRFPEGQTTRRDFYLSHRSLQSALFAITAAYGVTFQLSETELVFTKLSELKPSSGEEMLTRTWTVPPSFSSELAALFATDDRHLAESPPIAELISKFGILLTKDSALSLSPETSALVLRHGKSELTQLDDIIASAMYKQPIQYHNENTLITSAVALDLKTGYSLPNEANTLLDSIQQTNSTEIAVLPSTLSRPGEPAMLEMLEQTAPASSSGDWAGLKLTTQVDRYGFGYRPQLSLESRDGGSSAQSSILADASFETSDIAPSAHVLIQHRKTPNGQHQYVISRISDLDATGRQVAPRE